MTVSGHWLPVYVYEYLLAASSVPMNLQVVGEPGRTNITVQWMAPISPNGVITSYNVRYDIDTDTDIDTNTDADRLILVY